MRRVDETGRERCTREVGCKAGSARSLDLTHDARDAEPGHERPVRKSNLRREAMRQPRGRQPHVRGDLHETMRLAGADPSPELRDGEAHLARELWRARSDDERRARPTQRGDTDGVTGKRNCDEALALVLRESITRHAIERSSLACIHATPTGPTYTTHPGESVREPSNGTRPSFIGA